MYTVFEEFFIALALKFRSLIYLELIFYIWCEVGVQIRSFAYRYPVGPAPFVEKTILSLLTGLSSLVKNQLTLGAGLISD